MLESGRMDLASAPEVNSTTNGSVATYKSLSEDNSNSQAKKVNQVEAMGKTDEVEIDDGAKEKMLNDPSNNEPSGKASEVIFISENGDAKIDIKNTAQILSGMGKEELMRYANDPFWVRLRWIMFIGFWVLWFSMLAGAIAIIVFAPKCTAPVPKKWWEKSPIVQIDATDVAGQDIQSIETSILDILKEQHIQTISCSSFLRGTSGRVEDYRDIKREVGDIEFFKEFIAAANRRSQRVVLEFDPNHSSINHPWFKKSVEREEPYTNYYIWADAKPGPDKIKLPPNNWLSVYGGSAWTWNEKRQQFYLHQLDTDQPDFNFHNPAVVDAFTDIFKFWVHRGVNGFRLGSTQYLTEDPAFSEERRSANAALPDEYAYLNHVHTYNRQENVKILKLWRDAIANATQGDELFALQDDVGADILALLNENQRIIDLPQSSEFLRTADAEIAAETLHRKISDWISQVNVSWPGWDVNGKEQPLKKRMPAAVADSITLMTLFLPGTPIFKLNDTLSAKDAFAQLATKRNEETFLYGNFTPRLINGTVFTYTRLKAGNPGYFVAYQSSRENAVIDVSGLDSMPSEVNIFTHSPNYRNYFKDGEELPTKLTSDKIPIAAKSTVVITYVPDS